MTASIAFRAAKILRGARDFIADPSHWVKFSFGMKGDVDAPDELQVADRVCSLGALGKAAGLDGWGCLMTDEAFLAERYLQDVVTKIDDFLSVPEFNDARETTHGDVVAAFDLAIEEACKIVRKEAEEIFPDGQKDHTP